MTLLASTATRVTANTAPEINARIRAEMEARVDRLHAEGPLSVESRLRELDHEWDVERCLETGAASLVLLGTTLGITRNRAWLVLPLGVAAFLMQHSMQGWCPPLPVLRRMGVRTADEINTERAKLKALLTA